MRYFHKERRLAILRTKLIANVSHELKSPVTSIRMFAEMLADSFAFRAGEDGVEFAAEGLGREDAVILTDSAAVERIVANFLDNAFKYRRAEGARVRLKLSGDRGSVSISVEDNGPGIPKRDRERIFEEFYRVRYEDYAIKGSGLGLSIAKRLAAKLGGEIQLESREGEGSRFTLVLPRKEAS